MRSLASFLLRLNPSRQRLGALALCVLGWLTFPGTIAAGIIAADDFETYSLGDLNGKNGGTGWSGAYVANSFYDVVNGGLTYNNGAVHIDGGSQSVQIGSVGNSPVITLARPFNGQTGTVYFSLLLQGSAIVEGDDFLQFSLNDDNDQDNAATFGVRNNQPGGGDTGFFNRSHNDSSSSLVRSTDKIAANVTYLLVGKAWMTSGTYQNVDFYLNPSTVTEPVVSQLTLANPNYNLNTNLLDYFTIRTSLLDADSTYRIDAFRVGTTYGDVVGSLSAVPEPSSLALVGIGSGLFAWLRRRNGTGKVV